MALAPYSRRKRSSIRQYITVLIVIIVILAAALLLRLLYYEVAHHETATKDYLFEPMAVAIAEDSEEITVPEGSIAYQINTKMTYRIQDGTLDLSAANPQGSAYYIKVRLLDAEREQLLETGLLKPGSQLKTVSAAGLLSKGDYPATAVFEAYDIATLEFLGTAECQVEISAS